MSTGDDAPQLQSASPFRQFIRRIWPWAIIAIGIAITVAWAFFLGYVFVKIFEVAI
jgi:hypothetical protein